MYTYKIHALTILKHISYGLPNQETMCGKSVARSDNFNKQGKDY